MYIIKNALKCISRSKGRNILIGVIVLVIAVSACLGLSIRQAAESAREDTMSGMSVTATISFDRSSMMSDMKDQMQSMYPSEMGEGGGFDRGQFAEMMGSSSSLTLEEYQTYAEAESVQDFYYTLTAYFNGGDGLAPVSTNTDESEGSSESTSGIMGMPGGMEMGMGGGKGEIFRMAQSGDFTVVGCSSESAMTSFIDGTASITDGVVFDEGTEEAQCIISEELAVYNDLEVGDVITVANPNDEEEVYELTVVGIYADSSANESSFGMMGSMTMSDPANKIYISAAALQIIVDASESVSETLTDEDTGREFESVLTSSLSATYVFADTNDYYTFEEEVRALGLDDSYTVSSSDITAFESSLTPLETLSTMAGYFLIVILAIGAVILIVLNIFNVRERKYEIGVLTAMGMKKVKVAMQFLCEIFVVTLVAVIIGAGIGAACSVPVTNALLENQVSASTERDEMVEQNLGRGDSMGEAPEMPSGDVSEMSGGKGGFGGMMDNVIGGAANYITEVNSAVNLTVLLQMAGIAVILTLVSGAVSMLFVMRYEPLKILANRD